MAWRSHDSWARIFSLGVAETTAGILEDAGFDGCGSKDVHEPVLYGHDLDAALAFVRGFQNTSVALASLSEGEAARTVECLRELLAAHHVQRPRGQPIRSASSTMIPAGPRR